MALPSELVFYSSACFVYVYVGMFVIAMAITMIFFLRWLFCACRCLGGEMDWYESLRQGPESDYMPDSCGTRLSFTTS